MLALLGALGLAVLKLALLTWNAPAAPQVVNSAARIGTVAADLVMKEADVPGQPRQLMTEEADTLRRERIAPAGGAAQPSPPAAAARQPRPVPPFSRRGRRRFGCVFG